MKFEPTKGREMDNRPINCEHWFDHPELGDTSISCAKCGLSIPLSEFQGKSIVFHPEMRKSKQTLRELEQAIRVALAYLADDEN